MFGSNEGRILEMAPRKLREGVAYHEGSILFHPKSVLLGVARVKHIVTAEEHEEEEDGIW